MHYYDGTDNGDAKLDIQKMTFSGGWPSVTHNFSSIHSCGGISEGLYRFVNQNSGKSIEIANASTDNGGNVVQYDFFDGLHQQWYVIDQGTGAYSLINAGSLKGMDVWEGSTSAGANIAQWDYWGSDGQKWYINPVGSVVEVQSVLSDLVLDVYGASDANGANIIQWNSTEGGNQRWSMIRQY